MSLSFTQEGNEYSISCGPYAFRIMQGNPPVSAQWLVYEKGKLEPKGYLSLDNAKNAARQALERKVTEHYSNAVAMMYALGLK